MTHQSTFLSGVIEGFYGPPWSTHERLELFDQLSAWGLNTYMYAPKDDLKHRALWRQSYSPEQCQSLKEMIQACHARGLRYVYALSPGLDMSFSNNSEMDLLLGRLSQVESLGCCDFALLFDDIPDVMQDRDRERFGSFASAQCWVTNVAFREIQRRHSGSRFLFCPTPYCGRMQRRQLGGANYLQTVGQELDMGIDVFWTGPETISQSITPQDLECVTGWLRRKPLIWDNLHANDYDGRRWYSGPYAGRPLETRDRVSGILINPNCEYPINYVPVRTFADYVCCQGDWNPRESYLAALEKWWPRFDTPSGAISIEDLIQLCDCYYLPHEEGPGAERLYQAAATLANSSQDRWRENAAAFEHLAKPLRRTCAEIANLYDRSLFAALGRRTWELREELDLLLAFVRCRQQSPTATLQSDYHLPPTYRGGLVPRLQRLSKQNSDATFTF